MDSGLAYLAVALGLLQAAPSAAAAALAGRLPPNPLVGLRVAYTISSPRVWRRANRIAGLAFAAIGLASIPIGLLAGPGAQAAFLAAADTAAGVALVEYSRAMLERAQLSEPPTGGGAEPPPRLGAPLAALVWAAALAAAAAAGLAAARLAIEGLPGAAVALASPGALCVYTAFLSTARPEAYVRPWLGRRGARLLAAGVPLLLSVVTIAAAAPVWAGRAGVAALAAVVAAAGAAVAGLALLAAHAEG
ncbi:MAG: SdpI family protein [Desulfurococcales archaeon]|nr:SdpI family protein [Desulfurococcales archaeon]